MTTTDQTIARAACALAGALATDDPDISKHFVAIIAECFARSGLPVKQFERRVTAGLHPVLDYSTAAIAERTVGMTDEAAVAEIIRTEMFDALARAGRRILA
jgi:hypothetical protein